MTPASTVYTGDAAKVDRLLSGLIELEKDIGTPDGVRRLDTCRSLLLLNLADLQSRETAKQLVATCRRCGGAGATVGCGACGNTGKAAVVIVADDDDPDDTPLADPEPAVLGGEGG